jgi:hypothetical protein
MVSSHFFHVGRGEVVVRMGFPVVTLTKPKQDDGDHVGGALGQIRKHLDIAVFLRVKGILSGAGLTI